jgi:hypothetical protein
MRGCASPSWLQSSSRSASVWMLKWPMMLRSWLQLHFGSPCLCRAYLCWSLCLTLRHGGECARKKAKGKVKNVRRRSSCLASAPPRRNALQVLLEDRVDVLEAVDEDVAVLVGGSHAVGRGDRRGAGREVARK